MHHQRHRVLKEVKDPEMLRPPCEHKHGHAYVEHSCITQDTCRMHDGLRRCQTYAWHGMLHSSLRTSERVQARFNEEINSYQGCTTARRPACIFGAPSSDPVSALRQRDQCHAARAPLQTRSKLPLSSLLRWLGALPCFLSTAARHTVILRQTFPTLEICSRDLFSVRGHINTGSLLQYSSGYRRRRILASAAATLSLGCCKCDLLDCSKEQLCGVKKTSSGLPRTLRRQV